MAKTPQVTPEERAKRAPLTGVLTIYDALRHLAQYGPGPTEAHRAELVAAIDDADPDAKPEPAPGTEPAQGGTA